MNTKTFAQNARNILIQGVTQKLFFWGFDKDGNTTESPTAVGGGMLFRGETYDDAGMIDRWNALRDALRKKSVEQIAEETAYTWFNRIMAIRILAKNGYDSPQLTYAEGSQHLPVILQKARRGTHPFLNDKETQRLKSIITDFSKETSAFGILLVGYCQAHPLLNRVFGSLKDYTSLLLPDDILSEDGFLNLLNTTEAISDEEYQEVELIGWLYQFYISEKKAQIFASFKKKKKAEVKDLPAATQFFTPNWIVKYMVENTVGKIWLDLHPDSDLKQDMKYLVEGENPEYGNPIISEVAQLKLLDPAVGSGHILVEGFDLLYKMYLTEYYSPEEAVESIFKNNLFGLDIDKRAVQLAQFAVVLKAARYHREVLTKGWLPNIYAMPEPQDFSRQEVLDFLGKEGVAYEEPLSNALQLMQQAQNLGSIMQFDLKKEAIDFIKKRWGELEKKTNLSFHEQALIPIITPFVNVLLVMLQKYESVVANPPYMGLRKLNIDLKEYIEKYFPNSKYDLCIAFMDVTMNFLKPCGLQSMINQQTWMFQSSLNQFRDNLLKKISIKSLLHLGKKVFQELSGEVVQSVAFSIKNKIESEPDVVYFNLTKTAKKEEKFHKGEDKYSSVNQNLFLKIPGTPIAYWASEKMANIFKSSNQIKNYADARQGMATSNNEKFLRFWYEVDLHKIKFHSLNAKEAQKSNMKWFPYLKGGGFKKWYGNHSFLINWENNGEEVLAYAARLYGSPTRTIKNISYYFRESIAWSDIGSKDLGARLNEPGFIFDAVSMSAFPKEERHKYQLLAFLCSKVNNSFISCLAPGLHYSTGYVSLVPYKPAHNNLSAQIDELAKENISKTKNSWNNHELSWNFRRLDLLNKNENLKKSYLLWQEGITSDFFNIHGNEEMLNKIFIGHYDLQSELEHSVSLKDITILEKELDRKTLEALEPTFREKGADAIELPIKRDVVMQQLISYAVGIMMGRYRLDVGGLHIAHPNPTEAEIQPYTYNGQQVKIDEDAIVPLMGAAGEFPDDAVLRFKELLDVIWGADTRTENLNFLQECLDRDLEDYMLKHFWKDHCQRYKKKPIYWLFRSKKGAFQVLVYMHRMNAFTVEKIRANYLLPHLKHLRAKIDHLANNEASLSTREGKELDKLRKQLQECEEYELLIKTAADRQIVFDLDDGVTENYKLFAEVVAKIK